MQQMWRMLVLFCSGMRHLAQYNSMLMLEFRAERAESISAEGARRSRNSWGRFRLRNGILRLDQGQRMGRNALDCVAWDACQVGGMRLCLLARMRA